MPAGAIAGIIIGVIILAIVATLAFFFVRRRSKRKSERGSEMTVLEPTLKYTEVDNESEGKSAYYYSNSEYEIDNSPRHNGRSELQGHSSRSELQGVARSELPG